MYFAKMLHNPQIRAGENDTIDGEFCFYFK